MALICAPTLPMNKGQRTWRAALLALSYANFAGLAHAETSIKAHPYQAEWGFATSGMETSISPGNDFYSYANGHYVKTLQIPADQTSYGPFDILAELTRERLRDILINAGRNVRDMPQTTTEKFGVYYATFMDDAAIEKLGVQPIMPALAKVKAVSDLRALSSIFGEAMASFQFSPFAIDVAADVNDPSRYIVSLDQGSLGLPDRDYYLKANFREKKAAYTRYVARLLTLAGWPQAQAQAEKIVDLETSLAQVQWSRVKCRDPIATNNLMSSADLAKKAPGIDWILFLQSAGIPKDKLHVRQVMVREPSAIAAMAKIIAQSDLSVVRSWLAFHLLDNAAPYLSSAFVDASFSFNQHTLKGQLQIAPRWKRAVAATNQAMGWAVGKAYVAQWFPPSAQARITALTKSVKAAFAVRLAHNKWMAPETRRKALRKLNNFEIQVGYPKSWRSYAKLTVRPGDCFGNAQRAVAFNWQHELSHIDKRVDRNEWQMTPQTVNAYNEPEQVEVVFPAAILQPPFFDPNGDEAVNFGAIGGVIGHEMTHSFDDEGRQFDEHGRLHQWWTPEDVKRFSALAGRLGKEYDGFEVLPGLHVNGALTMGENIADLGGLTLALDAYRASLNGKPAKERHGFSGEQRVFLGWAQVWREKLREDTVRARIVSDPHSPPKARVNIPVRNIDSWYRAFNVKPGDRLYLPQAERVIIW